MSPSLPLKPLPGPLVSTRTMHRGRNPFIIHNKFENRLYSAGYGVIITIIFYSLSEFEKWLCPFTIAIFSSTNGYNLSGTLTIYFEFDVLTLIYCFKHRLRSENDERRRLPNQVIHAFFTNCLRRSGPFDRRCIIRTRVNIRIGYNSFSSTDASCLITGLLIFVWYTHRYSLVILYS